jgi:hypothetical protein
MDSLQRSDHHRGADVRAGAAVSRARTAPVWVVTPTQAVLGIRGGYRHRVYRWVGGLAFGLAVGVVQGMKIGRHPRGSADAG